MEDMFLDVHIRVSRARCPMGRIELGTALAGSGISFLSQAAFLARPPQPEVQHRALCSAGVYSEGMVWTSHEMLPLPSRKWLWGPATAGRAIKLVQPWHSGLARTCSSLLPLASARRRRGWTAREP